MGCSHNLISGLRLLHFSISLLILLISSSSHLRIFNAEGRSLVQRANNHQDQTANEDQKAILRAHIGSRPPQCEKRCSSCAQCEAIQVPTNSTTISGIAYNRGDDTSNYRPMSWKCKCGNQIFNP